MSDIPPINPPAQHSGARLPTSRYPAIPLARPLAVFGKSFDVELSSGLTLNPDTVLRAAIGKSLQTVLREEGNLLPLTQFLYGIQGRHQLSPTTKDTIRRVTGPFGETVIDVLDGAPVPEDLDKLSDWSVVALPLGSLSPDCALDVVVSTFIELDDFASTLTACFRNEGPEAGEQMFQARFGQMLPAWRVLCPDLLLVSCLRIEPKQSFWAIPTARCLERRFFSPNRACSAATSSAALPFGTTSGMP